MPLINRVLNERWFTLCCQSFAGPHNETSLGDHKSHSSAGRRVQWADREEVAAGAEKVGVVWLVVRLGQRCEQF